MISRCCFSILFPAITKVLLPPRYNNICRRHLHSRVGTSILHPPHNRKTLTSTTRRDQFVSFLTMSQDQEKALLQAIINAPDDDAPRYAYADHLEKSGKKSHAEFIRAQLRLESEDLSQDERSQLEKVSDEWMKCESWDWVAKTYGGRAQKWTFRRGFIDRIETALFYDGATVEDMMEFLKLPPVYHIREASQLCELKGLVEALPKLEHLRGIELVYMYAFDNKLVDAILQSPHLRNLKTLIFHHDRNGGLVDEDVMVRGLMSPHRSNIEVLGVNIDSTWQGPSFKILEAIAKSPHLRNLKRLILTHAGCDRRAGLSVESIESLAASENLKQLEILDLRMTLATSDAWGTVMEMPQLARLKKLYLHEATEYDLAQRCHGGYLSQSDHWRSSFKARAPGVDFDTPIDDLFEDDWKNAMSWEQRNQQYLFGIGPYVKAGDYDGLVTRFREGCVKNLDEDKANEVDTLKGYSWWITKLTEGLKEILSRANKEQEETLVLRIDSTWIGTYYLYSCYTPENYDTKPIDMSKPFKENVIALANAQVKTDALEEAGELCARGASQSKLDPNVVKCYLLARIIADFGRALQDNKVTRPVYFSNFEVATKMGCKGSN